MAEMEIKQVHAISSSEVEKKEESGGGREDQRGKRKERWRKPWLQGKDGGEDDARRGPPRGQGLKKARRDDRYSRKTDYLQWMCRCCCGSVCRQDLLRQGESVPNPPSTAKPTEEQQQLHSFQSKREEKREIREVKM